MKILIIGDSLVKGSTGVNWIRHLSRKHPEWVIENAGINGDTLMRIRDRLKKKLRMTRSYDAIVIAGGINDILIPALREKGPLFARAHDHLLQAGYQPVRSAEAAGEVYLDMISFVRQRTSAQVILLTMGCINEDCGYYLNEKKDIFNQSIRRVATATGCKLADVSQPFMHYLARRKTRNYLMENFFNSSWLDAWQCILLNRADALSRRRKLHLTIDGLHLNSRGGVILMNEVERQLLYCNEPAWVRAARLD